MKSKFVKVLLVINGILIPIFIIYVLGNVLYDEFKNNRTSISNPENDDLPILKNIRKKKHSSLIKIPNSENYATAEYYVKGNDMLGLEVEELNLPYQVPKNTSNIIFLDSQFNQIRKLLKKKGSIKGIFISNIFSSHHNEVLKKLSHLSFFIAEEDSNNDGIINEFDQHYIYVSDLNGDNLTKVTDKIVTQFEWVNGDEILLTFAEDKNSKLRYGLYNVKTKTMTIPKTIED
ncbi:hypothetical protein [Tenacibaculum jejuense]|uniref:Uncharacterized protein n=1 Tax=Tenacibaculum jejuense TaxID=584609 RepID=A0A238U7W7_9FLAO|nr:hypothetical protein [Tenacibaculum jejuense]SNR15182.1 conserved protein of unknown function [Tenacibaculum jejuense]